MYYKLGQACVTNWGSFVLLQIRANVVTNWGSFIITNWGKCCYKLGQLLQIGAKCITNCGRYYKLGLLLQIGAWHTFLFAQTTRRLCCYCHKLRFFKFVESFKGLFHHSGNWMYLICIRLWTTTTSDEMNFTKNFTKWSEEVLYEI